MTRQECVYLHLQKYRPSKMNRVVSIPFLHFLDDILDTYNDNDCPEWIYLSIYKYRTRKKSYYNWVKLLESMGGIETKLETKIYKQHPEHTLTYKRLFYKINEEKIKEIMYEPPI